MPTETNIIIATDKEYNNEDLRFLKRWAAIFFNVKIKSVLLAQNKVRYAINF
jgi:hypothetical protein